MKFNCVVNPFIVALVVLAIPFRTQCGVHNSTEGVEKVSADAHTLNNSLIFSTKSQTAHRPPETHPKTTDMPKAKPTSSIKTQNLSVSASTSLTNKKNHPKSDVQVINPSSGERKNDSKIVNEFPKTSHSPDKSDSNRHWMEGGSVPSKTVHDISNGSLLSSIVETPAALKPHKNISARKGAPVDLSEEHSLPEGVQASQIVSSSTTAIPVVRRKLKPLFTMVKGDKFTKESESFIESSTTGKDYVLPIVLIILAVPAFAFLVKFLYKRGTEFTERQQYHRMYLIDGMYNAR